MDRISQLRVFIRIAACGSFSQAADQLGLPRASVSLAMQQLEHRLDARLLHRTTRRVGLTPDGEALLERAAALVADLEDLEHQFRPTADAITGRLRVDVPSRIARRLIAPALQTFLDRHPQIDIGLGSTDRVVDLVQEGVDCALRVGMLAPSSLVARPLGFFELINCASPSYLRRYSMPQDPADLTRHLVVDYVSATTGRAAPWEWFEGAELRTAQPPSRVSANNAETYIACALAGLGLIQIPAFDVQEHLRHGDLVEVMPAARPKPMPVNLVYPHRHHLSRRMQVFLQWLEELLRPHLAPPARGHHSSPSS
jgi:DNA-binding transcriptional LysR family regulator